MQYKKKWGGGEVGAKEKMSVYTQVNATVCVWAHEQACVLVCAK